MLMAMAEKRRGLCESKVVFLSGKMTPAVLVAVG